MTLDRQLEAARLCQLFGYPEETCLRAINALGEPKAEELLASADEYGLSTAHVEMALTYEK